MATTGQGFDRKGVSNSPWADGQAIAHGFRSVYRPLEVSSEGER